MILVDYNQAMISSMTGKWSKKLIIDEKSIRTIFIERIRTISKRWKPTYGNLVIACDGRNYWRKEIFPYYKHGRHAVRENSNLDWTLIHTMLNTFREELTEHFPYPVIHQDGIEADDIIAHLIKNRVDNEKSLIFSGDGDFLQLKKYENVDQYSPIQQKFMSVENPILFIKNKIIRGDPGDGIPNILSPDNVFLQDGVKQTAISKRKMEEFENTDLSNHRGFIRNQMLIDFDYIPERILNKIDELFEYQKNKPFVKQMLMKHFFNTKQIQFIEKIQDF